MYVTNVCYTDIKGSSSAILSNETIKTQAKMQKQIFLQVISKMTFRNYDQILFQYFYH